MGSIDGGVNIDESCGIDVGCGACKTKRYAAHFCQRFATARWALVCLGFGAIVQGFLVNGHTPAIISTLERRFELSSTESALVSSSYDIAGAATVVFVGYIGGRGHKPQWIGWGMFFIGLSGLIFSLPHFAAPEHVLHIVLNLCRNAKSETCSISLLKNFRFVFYAAMLICGAGASPLYSLTLTYLDENVKQRYSSFYNAIFVAMSIVGPGVGFLAGSALLRMYTYPNQEVSIGRSHELWVGAWWIGPIIFGSIGIIASIPVLMLPRVIPGTEKHRLARKDEVQRTAISSADDAEFGKRLRDFPKCTLTLLSNIPFVFLTLGIAGDSFLIGGMTTFGAKYVETQFGINPSAAGTYFGLLVILGGAGGQMFGGWVISKFDLTVRTMLHMNYIAPILSLICCLSYLIKCSNSVFAGIVTPYHDFPSEDVAGINSPCNADCGCSRGVYSPICGIDGVTYFSSCFAGCSNQTNKVYENCSCITIMNEENQGFSPTTSDSATSGACLDQRCSSGWEIIIFCLCNFLLMFLTFFNAASALQVSLRCVGFYRRSFAVGIQTLFSRSLGTIPGPIVVGALLDRACNYWSQECGTRGSCIAYSNQKLSLHVFLFLFIGKAVDIVVFLLAYLTYKPAAVMPSEEVNDKQVSQTSTTHNNHERAEEQLSRPCYCYFLPGMVPTTSFTSVGQPHSDPAASSTEDSNPE